jgi:VWFA-related protein
MKRRERPGSAVAPAVVCLAAVLLAGPGFAQEPDATVTNVAVPVRVTAGGRFVDSLTRNDFVVKENDRPQDILALYLVRQDAVAREDAVRVLTPAVERNWILLFQLTDFHPKLAELAQGLLKKTVRPGDRLTVQTPLRNYTLSPRAFDLKTPATLVEELTRLLRRDIQLGSADYNTQFTELKKIVRSIADVNPMRSIGDIPEANVQDELNIMIPRYKDALEKMDRARVVDGRFFLQLADRLRAIRGRKDVFLVYQREFRPEIQPVVLSQLLNQVQGDPDLEAEIQSLFVLRSRDFSFDADGVIRAFADAGTTFHFIYMNKDPEDVVGLVMRETSEDYFRVFSELARGSGGTVDTSQDPAQGFLAASEAVGDYYLLYYEPRDKQPDGRFRVISVELKEPRPDHRLTFRAGYYAR